MTAPTSTEPTAAEIRAWAVANGLDVGTRGRISQAVKDAYAEQAKK